MFHFELFVCPCVCAYMCPGESRRVCQAPWSWATGYCKLPNEDAGNNTAEPSLQQLISFLTWCTNMVKSSAVFFLGLRRWVVNGKNQDFGIVPNPSKGLTVWIWNVPCRSMYLNTWSPACSTFWDCYENFGSLAVGCMTLGIALGLFTVPSLPLEQMQYH